MNKLFKMHRTPLRFWAVVMALAAVTNPLTRPAQPAQAQTTTPLNCSAAYQIVQTLGNGAKWEMCWEARAGYGYKLNQVTFTPANGTRRLILNTTHVAQLFVPYDDNGPRYHDISYGVNMATLTAAECPGGTLLTNSTLCLVRRPTGYAFNDIAGATQVQGESFAVFGYYSVGNYYYIFQYTFGDDGAIQPAVGASGSLQRFAGTTSTGWPVKNQIGVNHNHRVIWRMDFDLNGNAYNVAEQIDFGGNSTDTRNMTVTPLNTETKSQNDLEGLRFWRVRNTAANNAEGHSISYEIEPSVSDHYRAGEAFTQNDFYATQYNASEILVDDGNGLDSFVNGQAINDLIVWYGVNFHHVPRDEDDVRMPAHFQGFTLRPRDLEAGASNNSNPPTPTPLPTSTPVVATPTSSVPPTATPAPTSTPPPTTIPTLAPTATAAPNQLPSAAITAPGSSWVGGSFTFSANASDPDGSIARVEFYVDGNLVGSDTSAPYSITANISRGSHTLTAKAIDNRGGSRTSNAVSVYRWL